MKVKQLRKGFERIAAIVHQAGGREEVERGVEAFLRVFDGCDEKTVAAFEKMVDKGRERRAKERAG